MYRDRIVVTGVFGFAVALFSFCNCGLHAQAKPKPDKETNAPGDYVYKSTVRRVPVDVVMLDKQGKPVRGLSKKDFTVEEDKKPQTVLTFDSFDGSAPTFVPPKVPAMPPDTFVDIPHNAERGPLYVLYYDMVNTEPDQQGYFRARLLKFIDEAPPGVRIALFVNARGLHLMQGFTTDHALLKEAFLRKGPPPTVPDLFIYGDSYGRYDVGAALSNLNFMAEYLSGLPERKNVIWLSSYFPIPVGPTVVGLDTTRASSAPQLYSVGGQGGPATLDLSELEADAIKHAIAAMMRSRMALYPVSLAGVTGGGDAVVEQGYMDAIASSTGGHAYYSDNSPEKLIDKAIEHGSSYYTLTYSPQNTKFDGSERQIHVTVADSSKNYTLTYRTVYYALSDDDVQASRKKDELEQRFLAAKSEDTLYAALEHGAPMMHDVLFVAHLAVSGNPQMATPEEMRQLQDPPAYFKTRKKNQSPKPVAPVKLQKYVIDYDVIDPRLRALVTRGQKPVMLEFAAAAYNSDGTLVNNILNRGALTSERNADGNEQSHFHAEQELKVPLGATFIRVVVRSKLDDRTGALEIRLPLQQAGQTAKLSPAR